MKADNPEELLEKYEKGLCSEQEKAIIETALLSEGIEGDPPSEADIERVTEEVWKRLIDEKHSKGHNRLWPIIATVAAISSITISSWLYFDNPSTTIELDPIADIAPGGNKATLTFDNGKTISLSETKSGIVIDPGKIAYNDGTLIANNSDSESGFATITTPKGGQYQIVLSDGSKVYMNAASSLQYPLNLGKSGQRKVILKSGEAYFEVTKDKKRPFVVSAGSQEVLVLGTHFNINAYSPEGGVRTTLVEGTVKVTANKLGRNVMAKILKPGEQSINKDGSLAVHQVNTGIELAWKKGKIQFVRADLKTVMEMIGRWYDIEVIYQYYPIDGKFTGSISRSKHIVEVLNLLETTGEVHFKIEGRKVFVMR